MSSKTYFAYIRVSTARQGHFGTSLIEQRSAIERHAARHNLSIIKEFEEQETAAKDGRPVFRQMINELKEKNVSGIIIHKIDRSARNLKDWAELGELIDAGVEVHLANENLDLYSRGGRLSADIQAVIAADYIRNLKEEVKKGFYGRIKQGFYPMPAPLGCLNSGGGKVKAIDPTVAPLIRKVFELYASGKYSLHSLAHRMNEMGLRRKSGKTVSNSTISHILHNLFYTGIIRIKISEEYFIGLHEPIVSKKLFDTVQSRFECKMSKVLQPSRLQKAFLFRRLLMCAHCQHRLIGERQKGHNYYRCHTRACPQKSIREEKVRVSVWSILRKLERVLSNENEFQKWLAKRRQSFNERIAGKRTKLLEQLRVLNVN
jgi:site-specific DNA recombinase